MLYILRAMTQYQINLAEVETFEDFVAAFNVGVINSVSGHWNGNLDAFNDYLYWPEPHPYGLTLVGWQKCAVALAKVPAYGGRTMLSVIEEIFADNPQVVLSFA
jgi:hypothetical protein